MREFLKLNTTDEIADIEQLPGSSSIVRLRFKKSFPSIHIFLFKTSGGTELVFTDYIRYLVKDGDSVTGKGTDEHFPYLTRPNVSGGDPRVSYQLPWWKLRFETDYELVVITGWDLLNTTDETSGAKIQRFSFSTDKYLLTEPDVYLFQDSAKTKLNQTDIFKCYTVDRTDNNKDYEKRATLFIGYNNFNRVDGDFTTEFNSIIGREVKLHIVRELEYNDATGTKVKRIGKTHTLGNIRGYKRYRVTRDNVGVDTGGFLNGIINDLPKDRPSFPFTVRFRLFLSVKSNGEDVTVDETGDIPTGTGVTEICKPSEYKFIYNYKISNRSVSWYPSRYLTYVCGDERTESRIGNSWPLTEINLYKEDIKENKLILNGYTFSDSEPSIDPKESFFGKEGTKVTLTIKQLGSDGSIGSEIAKLSYTTASAVDYPEFNLTGVNINIGSKYRFEIRRENGNSINLTFNVNVKKPTVGTGVTAIDKYVFGAIDGSGYYTSGGQPLKRGLYLYHPQLGNDAFFYTYWQNGNTIVYGNNGNKVPLKIKKGDGWMIGIALPIFGTKGLTKKQKEIYSVTIKFVKAGAEQNYKTYTFGYDDSLVGCFRSIPMEENASTDNTISYTRGYLFGYKRPESPTQVYDNTNESGNNGAASACYVQYIPIDNLDLEVDVKYGMIPSFTFLNPDGQVVAHTYKERESDPVSTPFDFITLVNDRLDKPNPKVIGESPLGSSMYYTNPTTLRHIDLYTEYPTGSVGVSTDIYHILISLSTATANVFNNVDYMPLMNTDKRKDTWLHGHSETWFLGYDHSIQLPDKGMEFRIPEYFTSNELLQYGGYSMLAEANNNYKRFGGHIQPHRYHIAFINNDGLLSLPTTITTERGSYYNKENSGTIINQPELRRSAIDSLTLSYNHRFHALDNNADRVLRPEDANPAVIISAGINYKKPDGQWGDFPPIIDNIMPKNYPKLNAIFKGDIKLDLIKSNGDIFYSKTMTNFVNMIQYYDTRSYRTPTGGLSMDIMNKIHYSDVASLGIKNKIDFKTAGVTKVKVSISYKISIPMQKINPDGSIVSYAITKEGTQEFEKDVNGYFG